MPGRHGGPPVALIPSNPEVQQLLDRPWPAAGEEELALLDSLQAIADDEGAMILVQIIWHLCRLSLEPGRAEALWSKARQKQVACSAAMEQPVDFRVTLLSELLGDSGLSENMALVDSLWLQRMEASSIRDPDSGLSHMNYFFDCLPRDIIRAERALEALTVLAIELDDPAGHYASCPIDDAREIMLRLAHRIEGCVRASDQAFGGQGGRFAVVLAGTPKGEALRVAERFRLRIPDLLADLQVGEEPWTISIGVAAYPGDAHQGDLLWERALMALDAARAEGGNRSWLHADDRRSAHRYPTELSCTLHPLGRESLQAEVVNTSELGLCVSSELELRKGSLVEVRVALSELLEVVLISRVVWGRKQEDGGFRSGLRIVDMNAPDRHRLATHLRELETLEEDAD